MPTGTRKRETYISGPLVIKHPLADLSIKFKVPELKKSILSHIKNALRECEEEWVSGEELLREARQRNPNFDTPGFKIRVYRHREGISQKEFAKRLSIKIPNLSAMEHNKRPVGKAMAKKIGKILKVPYQKFL